MKTASWQNIIAAALVGASAALAPLPALAQQKPTRMLIFAAGGPVELVARHLAAKLGPILGTQVLVEARPGANGSVAAQAVVNSEPDGKTLLFASAGLLTITPTLTPNLGYNADRDLAPVSRVVVNGSAVVVGAHIPASNMREFIAYAKAQAQPLVFGSPGVGNIGHLWLEQFKSATGLELVHVPYKGVVPAITDILGGRIAGTMADLPALLAHINAGRMRVLGLIGAERNAAAPNIPTLYEQGFKGVEAVSWYCVLAPVKTPRAVIMRLNEGIAKALGDAELKSALMATGVLPSASSPEDVTRLIQSERARWAKLIADKQITVD